MGNRHLDGGQLEARVADLGGFGTDAYDRLVGKVVSAASKHNKAAKTSATTPSLDLAPAPGTIVLAGPSLMSSTPGEASASAACGPITPETPTSHDKSAGFWTTVGMGILVGGVTALTGELHGTINGIGEVLASSEPLVSKPTTNVRRHAETAAHDQASEPRETQGTQTPRPEEGWIH